jgi:hypothetical protein
VRENLSVNGTLTVDKDIVVASNIMPTTSSTQYIGSALNPFKEAWIDTIHISQNTLYLGDTPVLGTDNDSIAIKADVDQSIVIKTTGLGKSTMTSVKGVEITTSGLNSVVDLLASGSGGRVAVGATAEVSLNAPMTTVSSNMTVQGNLTVNGSQFTVNAQTVTVQDNIMVLNAGQVGNGVSAGTAGISVDRGDEPDYQILFDETTDKFEMGPIGSLVPIATENFASEASNITNGVLGIARGGTGVSTGLSVLDANNISTGILGVTRGGTGVSTGLSVLDANNISTGILGVTRGGTGVLTGLSVLDANNISTGILGVTRGGTGVTLSTGTGSNVLSNNATMSNLNILGGIYQNGVPFKVGGGFDDGTVASPSITFTSDSNTGIYRVGEDKIGISTGGVSRMSILNDGKVGVGTATPTSRFHVAGGDAIFDGNVVASGGFGEAGCKVSTVIVPLSINQLQNTSKMIFENAPSSFKAIITSERPISGQEYATYEEFEVIWNGRSDTTPRIYNHKYIVNNTNFVLGKAKFFYDSTTRIFTIEHKRLYSSGGISCDVRAILIGAVNAPTANANSNTPAGVQITEVQGLCTIGDNTGANVGIGTTTPTSKFHVAEGEARFDSNIDVKGLIGMGASGRNKMIMLWGDNNDQNRHDYYGFGVSPYTLRYHVPENNRHVFYVATNSNASKEIMLIDTNGVYPSASATAGTLGTTTSRWSKIFGSNADFTGNVLTRNTANTTTDSTLGNYPLVISSSSATTGVAFISVQGYSGTYTPGASITFERLSGGTLRGNMHFSVQNTTSLTGTLLKAMTIGYNGNVGIGTSTPESKLHVVGDFRVGQDSAGVDGYDVKFNTKNAPNGAVFSESDQRTYIRGPKITSSAGNSAFWKMDFYAGNTNSHINSYYQGNTSSGTNLCLNLIGKGDVFVGSNLYPADAGVLGGTNNRWSTVFGSNADFNGTVAVTGYLKPKTLSLDAYGNGYQGLNSEGYSTQEVVHITSLDYAGYVNNFAITNGWGGYRSTCGLTWNTWNLGNNSFQRYDNTKLGWAMLNDGNNLSFRCLGDGFTGSNIPPGNNKIPLQITPDGITVRDTLTFLNTITNKKIDLWTSDSTSDHLYYGFGINNSALRYQVEKIDAAHVFYAGTSSTTSSELARISGNGTLAVAGAATAASFTPSSDDRIKSDEVFIEEATSTLRKLRPQTYNKWSAMDYTTNSNASCTRESGLIAQEIFYDAPELRHLVTIPEGADSNALYTTAITSSSDPSIDPDYKDWGSNIAFLNYIGLIPYLIKSIQEKDADLQIAQSNIATLESRITAAGW